MIFKKDQAFKYSDLEMFGEIDDYENPQGTVCMVTRNDGKMLFCEKFTNESQNGFFMSTSNARNFGIGKLRNDKYNGCLFSRDTNGVLSIDFYEDDKIIGPQLILEPNMICIAVEAPNGVKLIKYQKGVLNYGALYDMDKVFHVTPISENINLDFNFKDSEIYLRPYRFDSSLDSLVKTTYKHYTQKMDYYNQYGYGYIKWDDGDFALSEFYLGDRHGLGCYRWPNGDEYIGQFKFNKATGLGVYSEYNKKYYIGVFENKVKNGTFIEVDKYTLWIKKYSNNSQIGQYFKLDLNTFDLTHYFENGTSKFYSFFNC